MADGTFAATFNCKSCGGKITWPDGIDDDFVVRCATCDIDICSYGDLQAIAQRGG